MLTDNIRPLYLIPSNDGILKFFDSSRSKTLSVSRETLSFGINHRDISGKRWMNMTGKVNSLTTGYKILRDATITSITVQTQNIITEARFNIRVNGVDTNLHTSTISSAKGIIEDNLNYDINKGDYLQLFMSVLIGNVDFPIVMIEIAWR